MRMRRKLVVGSVAATLVCLISISFVHADEAAAVLVNGRPERYRPPAVVRSGALYIPLRAAAASPGLKCSWHHERKQAEVWGQSGRALVAASQGRLEGGHFFLSAREFGVATGALVLWSPTTRTLRLRALPGRGPGQSPGCCG